jgi:acetoin:2,6-dichlorophenolindophenol oxidoreductase subunit beta
VIFIEHMDMYVRRGLVPSEPVAMPLARIGIERTGDEITIACVGQALHPASDAAEELDVDAEIISLRTLQPLDLDGLLTSVKRTRRLVVVEESPPRCSISADISASVGEALSGHLLAPVARVNTLASPAPFSPPLEDAYLPNKGRIANAITATLTA